MMSIYPFRIPQVYAAGWLSGWSKRVKLTIDRNDVTSSLSNFPVLVYLSTASGRGTPKDDLSCVFTELQNNDANRKKIAVTTSEGTAECYVEIERWDSANKKAWLWVKVPSVSSSADTDLYLYYDKDHADNTAYVGDVGTTVAANVWDANFLAVYHMSETPPSATLDSSNNNRDLTTYNGPTVDNGVIGKAIRFDGSDDRLGLSTASITFDSFTCEVWASADVWSDYRTYIDIGDYYFDYYTQDGVLKVVPGDYPISGTLSGTAWRHIVARYNDSASSNRLRGFVNGSITSQTPSASYGTFSDNLLVIAAFYMSGSYYDFWDGILDEVRISNTPRTDAWIKASYEGERDHLIDYGSEEPGTTLLTYNSKYVIASTTAATTTSSSLVDDTYASQAFSLTASQTVLVIYQANNVYGATMAGTGMQNAISIDGSDKAYSWDSPYDPNYPTRNTVFWIGTLASGSHTIKGRFAVISSGTATISNRILLIYVLNGDAFLYLDSSTTSTTSSTSLVDDPAASFTFTPSGTCKALILYNAANSGASESAGGKIAAIRVGSTDYSQAEKSPFSNDYPDSVFTLWAMQLSASSTTVKGRFASSSGTISIHRRQLGVLMFADGTLLDTVSSDTQVSTTSSALQDDPQATISRTTSDTRELLVVAMGTKRSGTSSSATGECYGIKVNANDRANSRGSGVSDASANSAGIAYAENLASGSQTIKGRFSNNQGTDTAKIDSRRIVALWLSAGGGGPSTLLTFNSKYIVTSTTAAQTTSTSLVDDTQASQTFSLTASQTVLVIYQANNVYGATMPITGMQNAINVDGTDYANSWDSPFDETINPTRNTVFWIGTLASGSHTIKGRFASGTSGSTATVSNRILLIYILNGNAFYYLDSSTTSTTSSSSLVDDPQASFTFTPSGTCKALILYNCANSGATENGYGKKAAINIGGTDYSQAEKSAYDADYPDSIFTVWALSLSTSSTTVKGRFASNDGVTVTISRRQLGILMFADDTLLDTVSSNTQVSTTSNSLVDDSQATISRTTTDVRELLVVAMGTKRDGTIDSNYGECYGIMIDSTDRANSRGSSSYCPTTGEGACSAATVFAINMADGSHTIKGRFSTNYQTYTAKIDSRRIVALWLSTVPPPAPEFPLGALLPLFTGFAIFSILKILQHRYLK